MTEKRQRTPQEKKALSYAKDRRNAYRNNDKAARTAIPMRKAEENRRNRRKAHHALDILGRSDLDGEGTATSESSLKHDMERVGGWIKSPDKPLGEHVQDQAQRRGARTNRRKPG